VDCTKRDEISRTSNVLSLTVKKLLFLKHNVSGLFLREKCLLYGVIVTGAGIHYSKEPAILSLEKLDLRVYFHKNTPMRFRKTELKGYPRYLCVWTLDKRYFINIWYFDGGKVYSVKVKFTHRRRL